MSAAADATTTTTTFGRALVIDAGSDTLKVGFAGESDPQFTVPNAVAKPKKELRLLVGEQTVSGVKDYSSLEYVRPVDRGYITNWDTQAEIWSQVFDDSHLDIAERVSELGLLHTTQPFTLPGVLRAMDETVFEKFGFHSFYRCAGAG